MQSPDDPPVVALEVFEQLLRVNVPHEDVLPDPGHRHVLRLVEDAAVGARGSRDHVPELGGEEEPRQARHAAVRQRPDEEALDDGGDEVLAVPALAQLEYLILTLGHLALALKLVLQQNMLQYFCVENFD